MFGNEGSTDVAEAGVDVEVVEGRDLMEWAMKPDPEIGGRLVDKAGTGGMFDLLLDEEMVDDEVEEIDSLPLPPTPIDPPPIEAEEILAANFLNGLILPT